MLVKQKIKYIQSLGQKKFRDQEGLFIAEGPKIVKEFLQAGSANINELYAINEWINDNKKLLSDTEVIEVTPTELERISKLTTPNNVVAVVKQFDHEPTIKTKGSITLALDTIQDPGNLGSIIRIADWFGIKNIICSKDCADIYSSKVVQASMGSIARVNIIYAELETRLNATAGIPVYATALAGKAIDKIGKINEGILIIGNESRGIHENILAKADEKITIPGIGKAESLNAAVSAGIILSHITSNK